MARHNGPIKGLITLVSSETAESATFIAEPIAVTHAQFLTLEAGTLEVSATIAADDTEPIKYFAPAVSTVGTPVVTGTRRTGPTKGLLVFVNDTDATSSSYILEPVIATKANFDAVIAGTKHLQATMFTDTLGHMFFEATIKA
jgi:hypothetical protein